MAWDDGPMVLGGVVMGVVGAFAGAWMGVSIQRATTGCSYEDGCLAGGVLGFFSGEAAGVGLGVDLGNRGRGNLLAPVLVSEGIMAAALIVASHVRCSDTCGYTLAFALPMVQLVGAITVAHATTKRDQ